MNISSRVSGLLQRTAALGLVGLVSVSVVLVYARVSQTLASNEAMIAERRVQLGRMLDIAGWQPGTDEDDVGELEAVLARLFSAGDASAVSLAAFQQRLKRHALQAGVQIVKVTERPGLDDLGASWIGLQVTAIGRFGAVAGFVAAVESGAPYTAVRSARITADPDLKRASTPDARLDARLEFYSPVRPDASDR